MEKIATGKKLELIKKLEHLILFQNTCLMEGRWDDFDILQNVIEETEKKILKSKC